MARAGGAGSAHLSGIHLSEQNAPDPRSQATPPPPSVHDVRDRDVRVRLHVAYGQYGLVRFNPPGSPGASACLVRTRFDPPDSPDASHCASERLVHTRLSAHAGSSPLSAPVRASRSAVCVWGTTQGRRSACTLPNTQGRFQEPTRDGVRGRGAEHALRYHRRLCPSLSIRLVRTRRLEPLVSPFRAFRSPGCAWCTIRAGRSD